MIRRNAFLALFVNCYLNSSAAADPYAAAPPYNPSASWCDNDLPYSTGKERYVPDGAVTQVGPYFFRVCQGGPEGSTPDRRVMRFFYNPERVEGLSSVKVMTGLMINSLGTWERQRQLLFDSHVLVGKQQIGRTNYQVYRFVFLNPAELGKPTYLYEDDTVAGESDLPPHMFECTEPVTSAYALQGSCSLFVGYGEIFANLLFLSLAPDSPRIPVERFPNIALDVRRTLETADVTEERIGLRSELPFVE